MYNFEISEAGKKACAEVLSTLLKDSVNKAVIYLSGPATGVPNYKENFNDLKNMLYRHSFNSDQYYIINPMSIYDDLPEEVTYIDKLNIGYKIIETIVDFLIVDDTNYQAVINSKGVTCELLQAYNSRIPIMYVSDFLIDIMNRAEEDNGGDNNG